MKRTKGEAKLRFINFSDEIDISTLGECTVWKSGGTPKKDVLHYWKGDIPWISASEMRGKYYSNSQYNISQEALKKGSTLAVAGSILLLVRGSMLFKKIPVGITTKDVAFNQDIKSLVVKDNIEVDYLYQWFCANEHKIMNLVVGTGIGAGKLDTNDMKSIEINLPSIAEQQKTASFLSSVDKKISHLQQQKILLEQYKKGVMKQIFNQELRFKDDNGNDYPEWNKKKLGEVYYSEKGNGISKGELNSNGKYECILYGELYTKYNEVIYNVKSKTDSSKGLLSKVNDLLIPSSTTTTGIDLANVTALNFNNIRLGGDIIVLRSNEKSNNIFYAYYLSNRKKNEIASRAQGITIVHLYFNSIRDIEIDLPSIEEQTKIAEFLSSIDSEIQLVNTQLENTQQFKKGLLQQMFV